MWVSLTQLYVIFHLSQPEATAAYLSFLTRLRTGASEGEAAVTARQAMAAFGFINRNELFRALTKHPAFDVDPFTREVTLQSHFMEQALDNYIASKV